MKGPGMDMFDSRSAAPMLIGVESQPFDNDEWIYELKLDGERTLAYLDRKGTLLVNKRSIRLLAKFPELATLNDSVHCRCILDGELVIVDENGHPDFEEVKRRGLMTRKMAIERAAESRPAVFVVFDVLYDIDQDITRLPLMERKAVLDNLVKDNAQISVARYVEKQGIAFYDLAKKRHLEGIVAKRKDSIYVPGKRTKDWVKIKNLMDDDYIICGYVSNVEYVVSLVLGQYDHFGRMIYKGRVTLAKSSEDFTLIGKQPKVKRCPFSEKPPAYVDNAVWIRPKLVCRVAFMARNHNGLMRQPVYKGLRLDKTAKETLEPDIMN